MSPSYLTLWSSGLQNRFPAKGAGFESSSARPKVLGVAVQKSTILEIIYRYLPLYNDVIGGDRDIVEEFPFVESLETLQI